jgi:hypothetical protein
MVMLAAGPAMADTGMSTTTSSLPLCVAGSTDPLYNAACAPGVANSAGAVTLTLPGVGTLSFTIKADGTIDTTGTTPKSTATGTNFTAGTPKVSSDGTHITVTFINAATPTQTYTIKAKVVPPTSVAGAATTGAATVVAVAKPARNHDDQNEAKETETDKDDDSQSTSSTTLTLTSTGHDDHESSTGAAHEHQSGSQGSSKGGSQGDGGGD